MFELCSLKIFQIKKCHQSFSCCPAVRFRCCIFCCTCCSRCCNAFSNCSTCFFVNLLCGGCFCGLLFCCCFFSFSSFFSGGGGGIFFLSSSKAFCKFIRASLSEGSSFTAILYASMLSSSLLCFDNATPLL